MDLDGGGRDRARGDDGEELAEEVDALVHLLEAELSFRYSAMQSLASSVPVLRAERDQYFDTLTQVERACKLLPKSAAGGATEQLLEVGY
jgi:hypothetical protein